MGLFCTSIHIRTTDDERVADCLRQNAGLPAYVSVSSGGWVSVFPKVTESQDQKVLQALTSALSIELETAALAFLVHDSDIFRYVLCVKGTVADVYDSDPSYLDEGELPPSGGNVRMLLPYCVKGTSAAGLAKLLHNKDEDDTFWGDTLADQFGKKLGLPEDFALLSYNQLGRGEYSESIRLVDNDVPAGPAARVGSNRGVVVQLDDARARLRAVPIEKSEPTESSVQKLGAFEITVPHGWDFITRDAASANLSNGTICELRGTKHPNESYIGFVLLDPARFKGISTVEQVLSMRKATYVLDDGEYEASGVIPLVVNGISFETSRWTAVRRGDSRYGFVGIAAIPPDQSIWIDANSKAVSDIEETERMVRSIKRSGHKDHR